MPKERYARCFAPGVNYRSHDYIQMRVEDARQMVADGLAEVVNKGKDIRMFARKEIKLRDRSCSWSHRLMELVSEGNFHACAMLQAIKPHLVLTDWPDAVSPYANQVERDMIALPVDEFIARNHAGEAA
jgi:hypothetical protein